MFFVAACPIIETEKISAVASYQLCSCPSSGVNCSTNNQGTQTFFATFVRLQLITQIKLTVSPSSAVNPNLSFYALFSFTNYSGVWNTLQVSQYLVSLFFGIAN